MNIEKIQENILVTILKQAINDFIHNFIFIAFAFSGVLLLFGVENSVNYSKSSRSNSFTDVFIDFTTNFWTKLLCSFTYLLLVWGNGFYMFTVLNTPKLLGVFIVPIIFFSIFIWTLLMYSIIYSAYEEDYNVVRSLIINAKLLVIKPSNLLVSIFVVITSLFLVIIPIAYLFLTIYVMLVVIKKYEKNINLVKKLKQEYYVKRN